MIDEQMNRRQRLVIFLLLVSLTIFVFWSVQGNDFIRYDDGLYVVDNPQVQRGLRADGFLWAFTTTHASNWHPLTWLSLMADYELYGLHAAGYHWTNLLLHAGNVVLLFFVLQVMTGAVWRSFLVAALFAVHPLHVESVAWVAERKDVLSTLFWLLTMVSYTSYVRRGGMGRYLLVLMSFLLGLMAKPMLVTLPFVLLLLDWWPLGRFQTGNASYRLVKEKAPLIFFSAVSSFVTYTVQESSGSVTSLIHLSFGDRCAAALVAYASYVGKMIWPVNLAVFYPHPGTWPLWQVVASALVLAAITTACILLIREYPYLFVGWFWYVGTLVPVIGFVQVGEQSMADRYTYVPLIGLFIMVSWGAYDFFQRFRSGTVVLPILAIVAISCIVAGSRMQARYWQNSITLFQHALAVTRENYLAENNLGLALLDAHRPDEAAEHFRNALRIKPGYAKGYNNLGVTLAQQGNEKEAISCYLTALQLNKDSGGVRRNLGDLYFRMGRIDEALHQYAYALHSMPQSPDLHNSMGIALMKKERLAEAAQEFRKVLRLSPQHAEANNNLAMILTHRGSFSEAISYYARAIEVKPDYAEAHNNMAVALASLGRNREALAHIREALTLKPDYAEARRNLRVMERQSLP